MITGKNSPYHGDKTNEPGCLKNHLAELFTMYPCLQLLTGDAIFAQRPLLTAIQEYHRDYLVPTPNTGPINPPSSPL